MRSRSGIALLGAVVGLLAAMAAPALAFTGENGRIAFTKVVGGRYEAWVMNADGSSATPLSTSGFSEFEPIWSADGSRLAFASTRDSGGDNGEQEVYVMNPDGSGQTRLTTSAGRRPLPELVRRMARSSPSRALATAIARSTRWRRTARIRFGSPSARRPIDHHPAFSPDGSRIVFASGPDDASLQIHVMNADGSGTPVQLTSSPGGNRYPKWSPDGSKIAFASTRDGNFEIYVMNADGSGQTRLTTSATPDYDPAFSPDGTLLAWSATDAGGANQIFTMSSSGGPATQLTTGEGAFQPDWQALAPARRRRRAARPA